MLQRLREHIASLDEQLLRLVGERLRASRAVAAAKRAENLPIRNFRVEVEVLERARRVAQERNFDPELAQRLMRLLIEASVETQRELNLNADPERTHRRILVVGGGGRMGSWLCHFFQAQGHRVSVCDPGCEDGVPLEQGVQEADVVAVSTPLGDTRQMLERILSMPQNPLVFDIASLKGELIPVLRRAARAGKRATSLHPMFAPGPAVLSGRALLVCDAGNRAATEEARKLFSDTALGLVEVPLEQHDRIMSVVLGMSHAINLMFALALARFGISFKELGPLASNTFSHQIQTTAQVAGENPALYHQIQALNDNTPEVFQRLGEALEAFRQASAPEQGAAFLALMRECRSFFDG